MSDSADGPNVSTQGPKDQVHGVGGTSESQVKQEGIDHIKKEIGLSSTTGAASAGGAQLPSTNRGSDDAAGGDLGDDDPQQHQTTGGGLVETVKGYLGFGGAGDEQSRGDDVVVNDLTGASDDPATKPHHAAAGTATATGTKASMMASNNAGESKPNEGNSQPAAEQQQDAPRGDDHKGDSKEEGENSKEEKKPGKVMENKDAIPTAGGEKLGEKHWGESKIIPDNPKPSEEEGTASADGQPDDQTRDNTKKNAGDSDHSSGGNEKLMDKVKDKMHIAHKENS